jgi:hypothetical protein
VIAAWEPQRFRHARFARVADLVERFSSERDWPSVARLDECLAPELRGVGMRLVEAPKTKPALAADGLLDPASLYEVRIVEHGEIPTRPRNSHDLLNALIWAAFPHSKLALSRSLAAVQRERAKGRTKLPSTRTPEHDRLALIDEGALLCVTGSTSRSTWIFGHAILEHAYAGVFDVRGAAIDLSITAIEELDAPAARVAVDRAFASAELPSVMRGGAGISVEDPAE